MPAFNPEKIRTADFPFPVGTAVRGGLGSLYTVVDRDGFAFLACCSWCEEHAMASGWYPQQDNGRFLPRDLTEAGPELQAACRACVRDDYDTVPCPLPAGHDGDCIAVLDTDREPCGENDCHCYGVGPDHDVCACGCDCPRDADGQLIHEG